MPRELDELNKLEYSEDFYEEYFGEMELDEKEKEKRISLAKQLETLFLFFLFAYSEQHDMDYKAMIYEKYIIIALEFLKRNTVPAYIDDYAKKLASDVVRTTQSHDGEEFYTSKERGMLLSANEANTLGNYNQHIQAIKSGMRYKTWRTERDNKVRKTHKEIDGMTVGIFEPFQVGDSLMMFARDLETYGASMEEVANCRCVVQYSK